MIEFIIYAFLCLSIYAVYRRGTKTVITEIGNVFVYYPERYCIPPKWIRKHFCLRVKFIPKFALARLYIAIFFLCLIPISLIVYLVSGANLFVLGVFFLSTICVFIIDRVVFLITFCIYKKKVKSKEKE